LIGGLLQEHVANAATAKALYSAKQLPKDLPADWHFAVRDARRRVASALRASAFLSDIAGALEKNCGHGVVFRHLLAPPVSQDQFKLLCPKWSKSAENKSKPVTAMAAQAIAETILARLDPGLVRWLGGGASPSR
jgi:hypothetical protein